MMGRWKIPAAVIVAAIALCLSAAGLQTRQAPTPLQLRYPAYFGNRVFMPDNNPVTAEGVQLGRMLFYEKALSANNRLSCGSCHQQARAFTDGLAFSTGVDGTLQPRNTMSLVNLLWVRPLFWDGRAGTLEEQAVTPLTSAHEMGQSLEASARKLREKKPYPALFRRAFGSDSITGGRIVQALAQFERTLISANSRYDQYLQGRYQPTSSEQRGIDLFYSRAGCSHCHEGPKTSGTLFHNNGLDSLPADAGREKVTGQAIDRGRFRVVSLRNIALTGPYMHDGRFRTLEDVITHYSEHIVPSSTLSPFLQRAGMANGGRPALTAQERQDLLAFLHLLTDSSFITDKRFSDPFQNP